MKPNAASRHYAKSKMLAEVLSIRPALAYQPAELPPVVPASACIM